MEKYAAAKAQREAQVQGLLDSCTEMAKTLEEQWKTLEKGHSDLEAKKKSLAAQNGGSSVSDSDILDINAGGQIVRVTRGTLTQIKGSRLEAIFSGRWEKQLQRDPKGRIFLDVNPTCFKIIVDYLNECKIAPPETPPDLPRVDSENQAFLDGLLTALGLDSPPVEVDSLILSDPNHVHALLRFLDEDGLANGLTLLYRGSRDGMNANAFHQKCDGQGPTITVVKSTGGYIFGGYAANAWTTGHILNSEYANNSFLFGLSCHGGKQPVKMPHKASCLNSLHMESRYGPSFGENGRDFTINWYSSQRHGSSNLGGAYSIPPGGNRMYFTGTNGFTLLEIEVFKVSRQSPPSPNPTESWHDLTFDSFPKNIKMSFQAEKEALMEASHKLARLQDNFDKEQAAVQIFCSGDANKIVPLNVSGRSMAVKSSTLAKYPDSVLYKQFEDVNWNGKRTRETSPQEWGKPEVAAWSKKIPGLSEEVDHHFQDVTGSELLVLGREDIKDLGIKRPGTIALIVDAINNLRKEEEENSATFIEHSDYCFGKIIDHMRLKAMVSLGVPDPSPPEIREPDRKRFRRIVEYYFPKEESAKEFLA